MVVKDSIQKGIEDQAMKELEGKTRYDLIPAYPLDLLAKVYSFGCQKYEDNNWRKGISWSIAWGALMRHCWAWARGEDINQESGLPHLVHAAWWCFTLLEYARTHPELDDRLDK